MRVYSEQEVSQILERATARQQRQPSDPGTGLTLEDLERIGADVGLDPAHLKAAAAEIDAAGGVSQRRSRSAAHLYVERWVPGPLTEHAWDDLVAELRNNFGKAGLASMMPMNAPSGHVDHVGRNREWSHTDGLGVETRVLVSDRGDRVRLRLSQRVGMGTPVTDGSFVGVSLGWIPGVIIGALLAAQAGMPKGWMIPLVLVSMLVTGFLTFVYDRKWRNRMHDRLDTLSDNLAEILTTSSAEAAAQPAGVTAPLTTPAVRLDDLAEPTPDQAAVAASRVRS